MHKTAAKARIEVSIKACVFKMVQSDFCQTREVNLATEAIVRISITSVATLYHLQIDVLLCRSFCLLT